MAERRIIRLPLSDGLDRDSGGLAVEPGSFSRLLNLVPARGKVRRRGGLSWASTLVYTAEGAKLDAPGDCVLGIFPARSEGVGIAVGYRAADRTVHVNRINSNGTNPTWVGKWFTLHESAEFPPRIHAAESYGKVFLAHDEPAPLRRAPTVYYDRETNDLHTLKAILRDGPEGDPEGDGTGEVVYFRGVARHLSYLLGWGFGHGGENRPELVRVSLPGQPTVFDKNHYWIAGHRADPVLACLPMGNVVAVLKPAEKYNIIGTNFTDFGVLPGEELFGIASSRLGVVVGGVAYVWSLDGPRVHVGGGPSESIAPPLGVLDLDEAAIASGFAVYDPREECVVFVFPARDSNQGARAFALSISDPTDLRWAEWEFGPDLLSGSILYTGGTSASDVPPGYVEMTSAVDAGPDPESPDTLRTATITWLNSSETNDSMAGDEQLEIWVREVGGPWRFDRPVNVKPSAEQSATLWGLKSATKHEVTIRARRGNRYRDGFTGSDPDQWTAPEVSTVTFTTSISPAVLTSSWERLDEHTERIRLTLDSSDTTLPFRVFWRRAGGDWALLDDVPAGAEHYDVLIGNLLKNPGFEEGSLWWQDEQQSVREYIDDASLARTGSGSVRLVATSEVNNNRLEQRASLDGPFSPRLFPVEEGDMVRAGAWAFRESGSGTCRTRLFFYDEEGNSIQTLNNPNVAAQGTWGESGREIEAPVGAASVRMDLQVLNQPTSARFDDVYLKIESDLYPQGEEWLEFYVEHYSDDLPDGVASEPVVQWSGPPMPDGVKIVGNDFYRYHISWAARDHGRIRIEDTGLSDINDGVEYQPRAEPLASAGASSPYIGEIPVPAFFVSIDVLVRLRYETEYFGVTDYSEWVELATTVQIDVQDLP